MYQSPLYIPIGFSVDVFTFLVRNSEQKLNIALVAPLSMGHGYISDLEFFHPILRHFYSETTVGGYLVRTPME